MASLARQLIDFEAHYQDSHPEPSQAQPEKTLSVSETYRLIQAFYPKRSEEKYFLKNAPDVVPLSIPSPISTSSPSNRADLNAIDVIRSNTVLSWTPYIAAKKHSMRNYLLGMILLRGKPTGYAFSVYVARKRMEQRLVFRFVGTHYGLRKLDAPWSRGSQGDGEGDEGLSFVVGHEQGKEVNLVFEKTVGQLIARFERWEENREEKEYEDEIDAVCAKVSRMPGGFRDEEAAENEDGSRDWSFLISPRKTPQRPTTQGPSAFSPFSLSPLPSASDTQAWFRSIRRDLNPTSTSLPSSPLSLNNRSRSRSTRVLPTINRNTNAAMMELLDEVEGLFGIENGNDTDLKNGTLGFSRIHNHVVNFSRFFIRFYNYISNLGANINLKVKNLPSKILLLVIFFILPVTAFTLGFQAGTHAEQIYTAWVTMKEITFAFANDLWSSIKRVTIWRDCINELLEWMEEWFDLAMEWTERCRQWIVGG